MLLHATKLQGDDELNNRLKNKRKKKLDGAATTAFRRNIFTLIFPEIGSDFLGQKECSHQDSVLTVPHTPSHRQQQSQPIEHRQVGQVTLLAGLSLLHR